MGDGQADRAQSKKPTKSPAQRTSGQPDPVSEQDSLPQGPTENSKRPKKAAPVSDSDDSDSGHPTTAKPGPYTKKETQIADQSQGKVKEPNEKQDPAPGDDQAEAGKPKPKPRGTKPDQDPAPGDDQAEAGKPKPKPRGTKPGQDPAKETSDPRDPIIQQDFTPQGPTENSQSPKKAAPVGDSDDSDSGHPTNAKPGPSKKKPTQIADRSTPTEETPPKKPKVVKEITSIPSLMTPSDRGFDLNSQSEPSGISPSPHGLNSDPQEDVSDFYSPGPYMDNANLPGKG